MPFLPSLCRALLGEELRLGSVETWWCGQPEILAHVLDHLRRDGDQAGVSGRGGRHPAQARGSQRPASRSSARAWTSDASEKLAAAMRAAPGRFVAQRRVMPSTVPVIEGDELQPRSLVLRAFVVADGVDGYETMPGALAVVGGAADEIDISIARGARSKDTWVISDGAVSEFSLLRPPAQPVALTRGGGDLPSRVADNFFWLGRYAERAEAIARLARVICLRLADRGRRAFAADLAPLVAALRAQTRIASGGTDSVNGAPPARRRRAGSRGARARCSTRPTRGRCTRPRVRSNGWRVRSAIGCRWTAGRSWCRCNTRSATASARRERRAAAGAGGAPRPRGHDADRAGGLHVGEHDARGGLAVPGHGAAAGARAQHGARASSSALADVRPDETPVLEALLDTADSAMTYRRRYRATLQVAPVVDLLAADEGNPRSILFQLAALAEHVAALPHDPTLARRSAEERIAFEALSAFRLLDVDAACAGRTGACARRCAELCGGLVANMQRLSDALSGSYLAPATVSRSLASPESLNPRFVSLGEAGEGREAPRELPRPPRHRIHVRRRRCRPRITSCTCCRARRPGRRSATEIADGRCPSRRCAAIASTGSATVSTHFAIHERHTRLAVTSTLHRRHRAREPPPEDDGALGGGRATGCARRPTPRRARRSRWRCRRRASAPSAAARAFAAPSFPPGRPLAEAARELMHRIHAEFTYDAKATDVATPVDEVLRGRRGVCQDFAHVQIACLRAFGLAARYVSGYLVTHRARAGDRREAWSAPTPRTPGCRCGCRAAPGWTSIRPTTSSRPTATSSSPSAATSATSPRCAACCSAAGRHELIVGVSVTPA